MIAFLTAVIALLLLLDLHTTSEIIKRGAGSEANPVLEGVLNAGTPWHKRFWILAAIKFVSIAAIVAGAWYARNEELTPYILAILASFYAYIVLVNNLPIYLKAKR